MLSIPIHLNVFVITRPSLICLIAARIATMFTTGLKLFLFINPITSSFPLPCAQSHQSRRFKYPTLHHPSFPGWLQMISWSGWWPSRSHVFRRFSVGCNHFKSRLPALRPRLCLGRLHLCTTIYKSSPTHLLYSSFLPLHPDHRQIDAYHQSDNILRLADSKTTTLTTNDAFQNDIFSP